MSMGHLHSGGHSPGPLRHQNHVQIILCSIAEWLDYHMLVHYDNIDVYTCLCEEARFTLCNLANVQYAYELVGRDLN